MARAMSNYVIYLCIVMGTTTNIHHWSMSVGVYIRRSDPHLYPQGTHIHDPSEYLIPIHLPIANQLSAAMETYNQDF